jgi:DUF1365 family protein
MMNSAIYRGTIRHRRFTPVENAFRYRLFFMFLDLAEMPAVLDVHPLWSGGRVNLAYFRRQDYFGDERISLDRALRDHVESKTGRRPSGPVRMLTHLRYFGYCFNPVTFYYLSDSSDTRLETIVAEVTNTPWGSAIFTCSMTGATSIRIDAGDGSVFPKHFTFRPICPWTSTTIGASRSREIVSTCT